MSWLLRLIPSRAAILAALAALAGALFAWARRDARRAATQSLEKEDLEHAQEITDRISDSRADPERLRPFEGAGWRD